MKQWLKAHLGLWILALVAVLAAGGMLIARADAEAQYSRYEIIADYKDFQKMSQQSEHDMDWWLALLKEHGIQTVGLYECTLDSLHADLSIPVDVWDLEELRLVAGWQAILPTEIAERVLDSHCSYDFVVACHESEDMDWVVDHLIRRTEQLDYTEGERDGVRYLYVASSAEKNLKKLPLGFWPDTVTMLQDAGMIILPRTTTIEGLNGMRFMEAVLESFASVNPNPAYYYNAGDQLLGFDEPEQAYDKLLQWLNAHDTILLASEQMDQSGNDSWDGFEALCQDTGYRFVRTFYEWTFIQNRFAYYSYSGPEEITNSLFRAVVERNCRVVYLRAMLETDDDENYITDPVEYQKLLGDLNERLMDHGLQPGTAVPMPEVSQPFVLRLLVGIGAIAAAVLLLCTVLPLPTLWQWLLTAAGALAVLGAMVVMPEGAKLLLSIGAGVVYPTLTMLCLLRCLRDRAHEPETGCIWLECIGGMLLCVFGALCGAITTTAALSESAYMLEFRLYRAVKLMQIIPIGLYLLGYFILMLPEQLGLEAELRQQIGDGRGAWRRLSAWLSRSLEQPVKLRWAVWAVLTVALVGVAGVAGLYYIARTGNSTSVGISSLELMFRNVLEERLVARPRTKEFLIGVPCLMLFIYLQRRNWRLLPIFVGLGMAIGMTSFVNTFLHLRSPLYLSFARTGYAVLFGGMIGAAAIAVLEIVRVVRRKGRSRRV